MAKTNAKLYITSKQGISEKEVYFLTGSNLCFVNAMKRLSSRNYLIDVEFVDYQNLLNLMQVKKSYCNREVQIRRVFKSMQLKKNWLKEPKQSFLIEVVAGIEGLIKKPVNVRVVGDGVWSKALTQRWQKSLDNPEKYKEMGITPLVDITKDGKLRFHIIKSYGYLITFFEENIDNLVE